MSRDWLGLAAGTIVTALAFGILLLSSPAGECVK
jgi:hypothetical protein